MVVVNCRFFWRHFLAAQVAAPVLCFVKRRPSFRPQPVFPQHVPGTLRVGVTALLVTLTDLVGVADVVIALVIQEFLAVPGVIGRPCGTLLLADLLAVDLAVTTPPAPRTSQDLVVHTRAASHADTRGTAQDLCTALRSPQG